MNHFVITYDITDDDRRAKVRAWLRGWGDHVQYSVFCCELSPTQLAAVRAGLHDEIKHDEDQVLLFDLGPVGGRGGQSVLSIGLPFGPKKARDFIF